MAACTKIMHLVPNIQDGGQ